MKQSHTTKNTFLNVYGQIQPCAYRKPCETSVDSILAVLAVSIIHFRHTFLREAAKKFFFFSGPTTKRGGGKGPATKEKSLLDDS